MVKNKAFYAERIKRYDGEGDTMAANPQKALKVVLTGAPEVGKTSLASRFTRNVFVSHYINTIGCDYYIKNVEMEGCEVKLVIHDIGGSVVIRSFRQKYMESADIAFVVFALDNPATYNIDEFLADIDELKVRPSVAVIGNKLDLVDPDSVDLSSIEAKVTSLGVQLYQTSAKENIAVSDVFLSVTEQFLSENGSVHDQSPLKGFNAPGYHY
jgi:small GTP-binding protein